MQYGLVLNEIGMEPIFDSLQARVLQPMARYSSPRGARSIDPPSSCSTRWGRTSGWICTPTTRTSRSTCAADAVEGAVLTFCGNMGAADHRKFSYRHQHVKGHAIVHLGRRRHGADDLTSGERLNLIVWNTNLAFRNSVGYTDLQRQRKYEKELGPPDEVCLSYTHDRDYLTYKEPPSAAAKMTRRAWCPPLFAVHDPPDAPATGTLAEANAEARHRKQRLEAAFRRRLEEGGPVAEEEQEEEQRQEEEATIEDAVMLQRALREFVSDGGGGATCGATGSADGHGAARCLSRHTWIDPRSEPRRGEGPIFTPDDEMARLVL